MDNIIVFSNKKEDFSSDKDLIFIPSDYPSYEAYILKKLKYACIIGKREQIYDAKHEIGLLDEILRYIETKKLHEKNDSIAIYYTCFQLLEQNKETRWQLTPH